MKKPLVWLLALSVLLGAGYWVLRKHREPNALRKTNAAAASGKSAQPATTIVTARDIHFAITAAGELGPLDTVSVRPEVGGVGIMNIMLASITECVREIGILAGLFPGFKAARLSPIRALRYE